MNRARAEVEDQYGVAVAYVDLDIPEEVREALEPLLEPLTSQEQLLLIAQLVRDKSDEEAAERVASRRVTEGAGAIRNAAAATTSVTTGRWPSASRNGATKPPIWAAQTCGSCGVHLTYYRHGRPSDYCSAACKQVAYRRRKAQS